MINPDGSGERQLTRPATGVADNHPSWAPDGSRVVFERCGKNRCATATIAADGSDLRPLGRPCRHGATPTPKCDERGAPAWSPDGKSIVFNRAYGPIKHNTIKYSGLAVADPTGAHLRNLVISKPYAGDLRDGAWAPDGKRLVLTVSNSARAKPAKGMALFLINADGTGLHRLTPWKPPSRPRQLVTRRPADHLPLDPRRRRDVRRRALHDPPRRHRAHAAHRTPTPQAHPAPLLLPRRHRDHVRGFRPQRCRRHRDRQRRRNQPARRDPHRRMGQLSRLAASPVAIIDRPGPRNPVFPCVLSAVRWATSTPRAPLGRPSM